MEKRDGFGISTSNNDGISKIYAEKQVALHSSTFTKLKFRRFDLENRSFF